jgi:hypothetical protein
MVFPDCHVWPVIPASRDPAPLFFMFTMIAAIKSDWTPAFAGVTTSFG